MGYYKTMQEKNILDGRLPNVQDYCVASTCKDRCQVTSVEYTCNATYVPNTTIEVNYAATATTYPTTVAT